MNSFISDKIFCYYESWATYRQGNAKYSVADIKTSHCTHLIYAFIGLNENDGTIRILDSWNDIPIDIITPSFSYCGINQSLNQNKLNPKLCEKPEIRDYI